MECVEGENNNIIQAISSNIKLLNIQSFPIYVYGYNVITIEVPHEIIDMTDYIT